MKQINIQSTTELQNVNIFYNQVKMLLKSKKKNNLCV